MTGAPTNAGVAPAIAPAGPEHQSGIDDLWSRYFGRWSADRLARRRAWQFEDNPFVADRAPLVRVGLTDGRVVGHISGAPVPLSIDGRLTFPLVTAGLIADERARWLGFRLVRAVCGAGPVLAHVQHESSSTRRLFESAGGEVPPVTATRFNLCLSHRGAVCRAVRWRLPAWLDSAVTPGTVGWLGYLVTPRGAPARGRLPPLTARGSFDTRPVAEFGAAYDDLWSRARRRWRCCIDKTARYMNWRYLRCPTLHPRIVALHGGGGTLEAVGVGVTWTHLDRSRRPCGRSAEIVELITDRPEGPGVERLLVELLHALAADRPDHIGAASLHPSLHPLLERAGFVRTVSPAFQVALTGAPGALGAGPEDWYYSAADSDALYSSGL